LSKFKSLQVSRPFADIRSMAESSVAEFKLTVNAGSSLSEVFVIDGNFDLVARGQGVLETHLPAGEYLVKYRAGDRFKEDWIKLDQDLAIADYAAPIPNTVAPIAESAGWSTSESMFAEDLRRGHNLSIVVRDTEGIPPAEAVRIRRVDRTTIAEMTDPAASGWDTGVQSSVRGMGGTVPPGGYIVEVATRGLDPYAMPLWVAPGCSTQLFMERRALGMRGKRRRGPHLASASILIVGNQVPWSDVKRLLELAEAAKSVLSHDRALVPDTVEILQSLDQKFMCPMLGLLAAHLLRLKHEELRSKGDPSAVSIRSLLQTVIQNLGNLMPGSPDVGALALAMGLTSTADFSVPPMLAHSWAILVNPSSTSIPAASYADRIRPAVCAARPWLIWNKRKMIQSQPAKARAMKQSRAPLLPPELQEAANQLGKHLKVSLGSDGRVILTRK
jgi:hypothetical protein